VWMNTEFEVLTLVARAFKRVLKLSIERHEVLAAVVSKSCVDVTPCRLIVMDVSEERAASKFGVCQSKTKNMGQDSVLNRQ